MGGGDQARRSRWHEGAISVVAHGRSGLCVDDARGGQSCRMSHGQYGGGESAVARNDSRRHGWVRRGVRKGEVLTSSGFGGMNSMGN